MTKTGVLELMDLTSTWQKNNLPHVMNIPGGIIEPLTTHNWVRATYLSGMMAYYDLTKNEEIFNYVNGLCEDIDYKLGERERHADEFAIGRVYTDIFLVNREPKVLEDMYKRIDYIIENPKRGPVVGWNGDTNWSWADALFMAPPAWLKLYTCSGERKYLREMDVRFWDTYEHLYSKEDSLFFRDNRFKWNKEEDNVKSKNGQKVFWGGRGNGWVVGGLVDILTYTPGDYHNRKKYKQLYIEMMAKIASIQSEDGMWRTSLLDVEQYPVKEFSASAFFCYAMAWGYKQ
ncbi:rhamnogalacturonides degradation protein RhiN [Algibacter lectus]|uniref:Rhamnogalacturonides degradation protein RhiN n=2 Tax=Algibacter lectus TaxID=221126 RepID=A0A090X6X3_9FLAO|nr:rhamnogalacturonides degradation protein RhiN [Algibacter lectus]